MFSKEEEIVNAITHGIGALLSVAALAILIVYSSLYGNAWHVTSFAIFGMTMSILYFSSTFVHALPQGKAKDLFEILDHSSIYFFIAGTYTPFLLVAINGGLGWTLFGVVWCAAIGGTIFKTFFVKKFVLASTTLYIVMGWLIVFAWNPLVANISSVSLRFLVIGGILYTVGSIFYVWRIFKFHHAIWHLFALAGTACHFISVLRLLPS